MKLRVALFAFVLVKCFITVASDRCITVAILVKDKAHTLPLYLSCLEQQTWPKSKTYLYIRTNNNRDNSAEILRSWVEKVRDQYLDIYFDDSDVPEENIPNLNNMNGTARDLKCWARIRQESINWAFEHGSHYFIADCDNFIFPFTIEKVAEVNLPIIAPLLNSNCAYSNFHAAIDENGYMNPSSLYLPLVNREIKGLIEVPVVHCTYFINYDVLLDMGYDDDSYRFEYVIFSDNARKKSIGQYLDTREVYGFITFAETTTDLVAEPWFLSFCTQMQRARFKR